jgi:D-alanyl-D-alanine dipeptidase
MKKSMKFFLSFVILATALFACDEKEVSENKIPEEKAELQAGIDTVVKTQAEPEIKRAGLELLTDIQEINPSIRVELKYATTDNFMKKRLYFDIDKLYLQKDVAERLSDCQKYLKKLNPELSLLVYDGVRPLSVQQAMWDGLDTIPVAQRTKFVSNPASGSIHNYGAAVDLTICDATGKPLDMGAGYDDIREIAYPELEGEFLASGELTAEQVENRKLLRKVMASQGFTNIPTEWWHFNACNRATAKVKYEILK